MCSRSDRYPDTHGKLRVVTRNYDRSMTIPPWVQIVSIPAVASVLAAVLAGRFARKARMAESQAARLLALEERTARRKDEVYQPMIEALGDLLYPGRMQQALGRTRDVMGNFRKLCADLEFGRGR